LNPWKPEKAIKSRERDLLIIFAAHQNAKGKKMGICLVHSGRGRKPEVTIVKAFEEKGKGGASISKKY